jgi:ubiquinone/menaquinone biosynthesis C-methylase UbiE
VITVDFERLSIKPGFKILDIGCGPGRHTCAASRLKKVFAIGSDISFDDVAEARNRLDYQEAVEEKVEGKWGIVVADITALPFKDNSLDLVICSEVLEHIPDQNAAVEELVRVLQPGRDLVVSVPRYLPERICWALSEDYYEANNGHIRIYRKKELTTLLEKAGVKKWAAHFAHSLHTPYWWLKCLVGPNREDSFFVNLYHRFLVWDMMKRVWITRLLDTLLNPLLGKSIVLYMRKEKNV